MAAVNYMRRSISKFQVIVFHTDVTRTGRMEYKHVIKLGRGQGELVSASDVVMLLLVLVSSAVQLDKVPLKGRNYNDTKRAHLVFFFRRQRGTVVIQFRFDCSFEAIPYHVGSRLHWSLEQDIVQGDWTSCTQIDLPVRVTVFEIACFGQSCRSLIGRALIVKSSGPRLLNKSRNHTYNSIVIFFTYPPFAS